MLDFVKKTGRLAVAAGIGLLAATVSAQSFADVEFWVGQGANQAGFVIDWNDGLAEESLMWGFRWDGDATGADMLLAIVSADARLFTNISSPSGFGVAVYGLGYDLNNNGVFGVDPGLVFDQFGVSVGSPVDGRTPTDAGDHWQEGWMSDGFWSYWLGAGDNPAWDFSPVGMSSRALSNGSWDGWSYAVGFDSQAPSMPVAASVPAPASLALLAGGLVGMRRRRRAVAVAVVAGVGAGASAGYTYDPNDFAVEVVSSVGLPGTSLYNDPAAVLGGPSTWFNNAFTPGQTDLRRVKLIEPAFNTGPNGEKLITTFNAGQSVTVRMGRRVYDDPNNPYGIDLNIFGNAFFVGSGFVSDTTNLNAFTLSGGLFAENVQISVSPDNINWYTYTGITADGLFPTNAFAWDRANAAWTDALMDPTKPINPALHSMNFAGMTAADVLDLYDGAAGGMGFDLAASGFAWIEYVRIEGITGFSGGEIDAIAAVRAVPGPGAVAVLMVGGIAVVRRRR